MEKKQDEIKKTRNVFQPIIMMLYLQETTYFMIHITVKRKASKIGTQISRIVLYWCIRLNNIPASLQQEISIY